MAFAFAACGGNKDNGETTTAASDETTAADIDVTAASEDANATVAPDASEPASDATAATEESTAPETTANVAELVAPTATADILNIYNNAVNSAYNARAGFKKTRSTDNEVLDQGQVGHRHQKILSSQEHPYRLRHHRRYLHPR